MMKEALKSPWLTVSLAIVAMTVGYVFYLQKSGDIALANGYFCPAKQICQSDTCLENGCDKEECKRCKHCKGQTS